MKPARRWHRLPFALRLHLWRCALRDRWNLVLLRWVAPDPQDAEERQLVGWGIRAELLRQRRLQLVDDDHLEDCA